MQELRISLLHATYAAGDAAVVSRNRWFELAHHPGLLEHIFAFNADDVMSSTHPEISAGVAGPPQPGKVTAVRNWTNAARQATGDLLMVVADDLTPTQSNWDDLLRAGVCDLDPLTVAFAMKAQESLDGGEHLMRHPIVSQAFFSRYGLFDSCYQGIGADNDFTLRAHALGLVLDARHVVLRHDHPSMGAAPTTSQSVMSSDASQVEGKALFNERWPTWKRRLLMRYFTPTRGMVEVTALRLVGRRVICRLGWLRGLVPGVVRRWMRRRAAVHSADR